ncbi:putative protein phosphatase 2C-like protein 45 [Cardamine amara subsp. amara]|uniref:Uncharacterized protein n=1 Tax=Cardamine amara subsp. amara TaxID=228776 RepID=A0ABD1A9S6_CARAN
MGSPEFKRSTCRGIEIWPDCTMAVEAINNPKNWPRFRTYLDRYSCVRRHFHCCEVRLSSFTANVAARRIAKSGTRDDRFHSYLALGGPAWLLSVIEDDRSSETLP